MKKLFLILITVIAINCSNNDNGNSSQSSALLGEWKLMSFVNTETGININASDPNYYDPINEEEVDIILNFTDSNNIMEGTTSRNLLSAVYNVNNSMTVLIFLGKGISVTEAGETDFANLFFDSLALNFNSQTGNTESGFEFDEDSFKLYYSEFEYMLFEKQ